VLFLILNYLFSSQDGLAGWECGGPQPQATFCPGCERRTEHFDKLNVTPAEVLQPTHAHKPIGSNFHHLLPNACSHHLPDLY
jgi:hypothetical protein